MACPVLTPTKRRQNLYGITTTCAACRQEKDHLARSWLSRLLGGFGIKARDELLPRPQGPADGPDPPHRRAASLRSEEHTSELQSQFHLVCRLLLVKIKKKTWVLLYHLNHGPLSFFLPLYL